MSIAKAIQSIRRCEAELQALLREAAGVRDYDTVIQLGEWARRVASVLDGVPGGDIPDEPDNADGKSADDRAPKESLAFSAGALTTSRSAKASSRKRRSKKSPRRKPGGEYPKFARQGDQLIKIGWSRKQKREYQHKAPKAVTELLASVLASCPEAKSAVTTEEIFPLSELDGTEIPSYQSYLCLAWMRHVGLVVQEGRQGYRVPEPSSLLSDASDKWKALAPI